MFKRINGENIFKVLTAIKINSIQQIPINAHLCLSGRKKMIGNQIRSIRHQNDSYGYENNNKYRQKDKNFNRKKSF